MNVPIRITFRNMEPSKRMEDKITDRSAKLEKFARRIQSCDVVIEAPHKHRQKGNEFRVHLKLMTPRKEFVAQATNESAYVAIRDAFLTMSRQLKAHFARRRDAFRVPREVEAPSPPATVVA